MNAACPICGQFTRVKVIYFGLPGVLCLGADCSLLTGPAAYVPIWLAQLCSGEDGFSFLTYEGSYWPALWRWLTRGPE